MEMSSYDPAATIGVTALGENDDLDNGMDQQRRRDNDGNDSKKDDGDDDDERRDGGWLTRIVGSSSGSVSTSASSSRGVGSSSSSPDESLLLVSNLAESTTDGRRRRGDGAASSKTEGYEPPSLRAPPARDDDDDESPEERVRDECSLFYVGANDDPGAARSRTPAPLAVRSSASSASSRRDHIHFQRQDTARASGSGPGRGGYRHRLTYYSPYLGGDARDVTAAVSTADDEESVGRLRLADFSRSSLFYRNREGRVSMMLPSDSVRLLEDDQLEPGILLQVKDTQPPSYVLTVDALLYQRVVREIVARNSRCGLYFCFHENEEGGKVNIFIAVGILTVFFVTCLALFYFRDFE